MNIQIIGESEFNKIEASRRAIAHDYARKFAVLDLGDNLGCYGLSWRSELVEPIVERSADKQTVWVGVDPTGYSNLSVSGSDSSISGA